MLPSAGQGQRRIWFLDIICQLLLLIILYTVSPETYWLCVFDTGDSNLSRI